MEILIQHNKLNESPNVGNDIYTSDVSILNDIIDDIIHGTPTSYLISGYRGTGKSSFIENIEETIKNNKNSNELSKKLIFININFPKSIEHGHFLRKAIRKLYLEVNGNEEFKKSRNKHEEFKNLGILYDKTFYDVTHTQIKNKKSERQFTLGIDIILAATFLITLISNKLYQFFPSNDIIWWTGLIISIVLFVKEFSKMEFSFSHTKTDEEEENRKSLYDDEIADHHFFTLLKKFKDENFRIVFVFDELDKLENEELNSFMKLAKPYVLSGLANYIIVAGQNLFYEYTNSKYKDDGLLSSMFSRIIHIPLLSKTELYEIFDKITVNGKSFKGDLNAETHVTAFVDYLIFESKGVSRSFVGLIRRELKWRKKIDSSGREIRESYIEILSPIEKYTLYTKILNAIDTVYKEEIQVDDFTNGAIADYFKMQLILICHYILSNKHIPFLKKDVLSIEVSETNKEFDEFSILFLEKYVDRLFEILNEEKIITLDSKTSEYRLTTKAISNSISSSSNNDIYSDIIEFNSLVKRICTNFESFKPKTSGDYKASEFISYLHSQGNIVVSWHKEKDVLDIFDNIGTYNYNINPNTTNRIIEIFKNNNVNLGRTSFELIQYYSEHKITSYFQNFNYSSSKGKNHQEGNYDLILSNEQSDLPDLLFEYTWRKNDVLPLKDSIIKAYRRIKEYSQRNEVCYVFLLVYTDLVETSFINSNLRFKEQLSEFKEYEEFKEYIFYVPVSTHNIHLIKWRFEEFENEKIRTITKYVFENKEAPIKHLERNDCLYEKIYDIVNKKFDIKINPVDSKYWRFGIEFSKTIGFPDINRGRHSSDDVGYVVLTIGDQQENKTWSNEGRLYLWQYNINQIENDFSEINDYKSEEMTFLFSTDNIENTVEFVVKIRDKELGSIKYDLNDYKYFRISAWCEDSKFKLETIINEIHPFNKDRNLVTNFNFLIGTWKNFWSGKNKEDEIFRITSERKYEYLDGKHYFNIDKFHYDPLTKEVHFLKTSIISTDGRILENKLILENKDLLTGTENGNKIKYNRVIA